MEGMAETIKERDVHWRQWPAHARPHNVGGAGRELFF